MEENQMRTELELKSPTNVKELQSALRINYLTIYEHLCEI